MRKYRIGIPQLTWLYVEVEVDETSPDFEYVPDDDEAREAAIELAYEAARQHKFCHQCEGGGHGWSRAIDDLGTLVEAKVTLELDIEEGR